MKPLRIAGFVAVPAAIAATGVLVVSMTTVLTSGIDSGKSGGSVSCNAIVHAPAATANLSQEQLTNAMTIVQVGVDLGISRRGYVIAVATALQESTLRNLHYGDRDSVGLFQQRPSAGWGTVAELTDPPTAARKFYEALVEVDGWQNMPLTTAAQLVQRSGFPFAYAKWESLAQTLVDQMVSGDTVSVAATIRISEIGCGQVVGPALPNGIVGEMLQVARRQLGKPYLWGATGPSRFDCSGLVVYSWSQVGQPLAVRTAAQMYDVSDHVQTGSETPGDLLFGDFTAGVPHHVMIVMERGIAIEAPHAGDVVKIVTYDANDWSIGRLSSRAFLAGTLPG